MAHTDRRETIEKLIAGLNRQLDASGDPADRAAVEQLVPRLLDYQTSHPQAGSRTS